ncbi:unnamed protein product, partial [Urochloa humidicola]
AKVQGSLSWSDLPPELLGLAFLHLPTRANRAFFPAVCSTWCSAAQQSTLPSPSPVPWIVLPGGNIISFPHGEILQLPGGVLYHNSCGEWLLLSRDDDNNCFLLNPLPNLASYMFYEEPMEVPEDSMPPEADMPGPWSQNKEAEEISVLSLVLCSTRLIAAIVCFWGSWYNCTVPVRGCCMVSKRTQRVQVSLTHGLVPREALCS